MIYIIAMTFLHILVPVQSYGMPEDSLQTHTKKQVLSMIRKLNQGEMDFESVKNTLAQTGITELDSLWESRRDYLTPGCEREKNNCRIFSKFEGDAGNTKGNHPIVLLPGFTGYRKMYLEQVYDLLAAGYGPIYVADFVGSGESKKPFFNNGKPPTIKEYLDSLSTKTRNAFQKQLELISGAEANISLKTLEKLPIGLGHIEKFQDYNEDINFVLSTAAGENPQHKITVTALSMSGLSILYALVQSPEEQKWIKQVDRVVLESPMIRIRPTRFVNIVPRLLVRGIGRIYGKDVAASPSRSLPEFASKALGYFDPKNSITHSEPRLTLTDGLRAWNGFETAGATYGWILATLRAQYRILNTDLGGLNEQLEQLKDVLNNNHIHLITVASLADQIVETEATQKMMQDLGEYGTENAWMCLFQSAKHVIDQEIDKYRAPYMELLIDQMNDRVANTYGNKTKSELLHCSSSALRTPASNKQKK